MSLLDCKRRAMSWRSRGETFADLDLRSLHSPQSNWEDVAFVNCKLGLANFTSAQMTNVYFQECSIYGGAFGGTILRDVRFVNCDLEQSGFGNSVLSGVSFERSRLAYSSFFGAMFRNEVNFTDSNLHGADLDIADSDFGAADFTGTSLWGVKSAFGCKFWNGKFDQRTVNLFVGLAARVATDPEQKEALIKLSDGGFKTVSRLMDEK